jgi:heme O synthase-like polyprenyltransferase
VPQQLPVDRGFFRECDDGTTVFFPWGLTHRGYRLTSVAAKKRASRAVSFLVSSSIAIGVWIAHALEPALESDATGFPEVVSALVAPGAALFLAFASYFIWVSRFVERFPASDLKVTREERLREAAELVEPWKVALFGVIVSALSVFAIWLQPRAWWLGLLGVALGAGALLWSILLKRARVRPSG